MFVASAIITGTAALFASLSLNVSAAEFSSGNYAEVLPESGQDNPTASEEICKASYRDLAEAYGENWYIYLKHSPTADAVESREKISVSDFLAYAGESISSETTIPKNSNSINSCTPIAAAIACAANIAGNENIGMAIIGSNTENNTAENTNNYVAAVSNINRTPDGSSAGAITNIGNNNSSAADSNSRGSYINSALNTGENNDSAAESTDNRFVNTAANTGNNNYSAGNTDNSSVNTGNSSKPAVTDSSNNSTPAVTANLDSSSENVNTDSANASDGNGTENSQNYHHTTSIYTNDETLLRVEYYDENNKLFEYSDITGYDKETNSYTETVYQYDEENQVEIATRTDTYVNGELVSSEQH